MGPKRLVVIDGYSLLYRAFFATRFLSTSDGRPTNALLGFANMLFNLLENIQPDAIVVALDSPGKTFRHAEYSEYKGTRREIAPELKEQLPIARELIEKLGIPQVEITGFEADDIVGTIAKLAEANGYHTTIVTGDLDSLQLVDPAISVLTMKMGVSDTVTYDPEAVMQRYGFGPEFVPDFKAIKGDSSDNIPGVPGIGDKGAAELIQQFGTIEQMLDKWDDIPPKYQKKMEPVREQIPKSKWLATIRCDVPLTYDFKPFVLNRGQLEAAQAMFESLEFRSLHRRTPKTLGAYLDGSAPAVREGLAGAPEVESEKLEIALSKANDYASLAKFVEDRRYSVFFATTQAADLFETPERKAYVAVGKKAVETSEADALHLIAALPDLAVLHDAKPTYKSILKAEVESGKSKVESLNSKVLEPPRFDSLLAGYVLQSGRANYALRDLVQGYTDLQVPTEPHEMAGAMLVLEDAMLDRLEKEQQARVLQEIELPLVPVLADMETLGIKVDRDQLREFSKELEVTIDQTARKIFEIAGQEFAIGSPKQLGEVLFEKLKLPGAQKTKTGYATGAEVLQLIPPDYEIPGLVLSWREYSKLKSTYTDALAGLIREDGRIHTTYSMTVAATGRLSSNDPNLQNIPIRTELGRGIRKAFEGADGYALGSFDYSQIELRVLAHMCGEPALVDAFREHEDVHTATAQLMFGLGDEKPSKDQRNQAKTLNYAVLYGVSEFGLAQQMGGRFSIGEAKALITTYNERFPSVKGFTDSVIAEARAKGFTTTLMGRRRYFPDIHAPKIMERKAAERQAMNAPLQGTAADMLKLAMINIHRKLQGNPARMLLTVHDELVFELPVGDTSMVEPIRQEMESALPLSVPVEVDAKLGPNWNDMTPV
ncbi:MAG: DNA polymerase I [Fimbriimonadales bacterium]